MHDGRRWHAGKHDLSPMGEDGRLVLAEALDPMNQRWHPLLVVCTLTPYRGLSYCRAGCVAIVSSCMLSWSGLSDLRS